MARCPTQPSQHRNRWPSGVGLAVRHRRGASSPNDARRQLPRPRRGDLYGSQVHNDPHASNKGRDEQNPCQRIETAAGNGAPDDAPDDARHALRCVIRDRHTIRKSRRCLAIRSGADQPVTRRGGSAKRPERKNVEAAEVAFAGTRERKESQDLVRHRPPAAGLACMTGLYSV